MCSVLNRRRVDSAAITPNPPRRHRRLPPLPSLRLRAQASRLRPHPSSATTTDPRLRLA